MEDEDTAGQGPHENLAEPPPAAEAEVEDEDEEDDGFSFPAPPLAADACIVPVYPIFGRPPSPPPPAPGEDEPETATVRVPLGRLLLEEREFRALRQDARSESARAWQDDDDGDGDGASASADEELEGVSPESYCLWAPGGGQASAPAYPRRCRKSGSTGSVLRWRPRLVGRSQSDGKEKFVFLNTTGAASGRSGRKGRSGGGGATAALGDHAWSYYAGGAGAGNGARRRSFLPYKQDLVGLFANATVFRRSYHPF